MSTLLIVCILLSSFSFIGYTISYFVSPHMKNEFKRFKLEKLGLFTIILEILGAVGLLVGFIFTPILLLSSGGLALLMFLGFMVRLKTKDGLMITLPVIFYMCLNAYIFYAGLLL